jgi:hypothetical protein
MKIVVLSDVDHRALINRLTHLRGLLLGTEAVPEIEHLLEKVKEAQ